jgi:hypothetical protein
MQLSLGFRLAPFQWLDFPPVSHLRLEACFLLIHFREADETLAGPMGYVYWQWGP